MRVVAVAEDVAQQQATLGCLLGASVPFSTPQRLIFG